MKRLFNFKSILVIAVTLVSTLAFLQSCRKTIYNGTSGTPFNNSAMVMASIQGIVTDEAGAVVENASVTTGSYTTVTDANGFFHFDNISTPQRATCVLVNKGTYFTGSRTIMVKAGQKHTVKIGLLSKGIPETFVANNGGNVSFANGLSLSFPANAIVNKSTGLAYTGQVYVYAKKIDPTTEAGRLTMPGDLRGIGAGTEEDLLISYGMMVAELYTVDGQALQLKSGSEATMEMTIPSGVQTAANSRIPLWYFDEAKGMWVEDGYATLTGNKYVGKVKHFSFWNCDTPAAAIDLEMTLVDQTNTPLSGFVVKLKNTANNDTRQGTTNSSGWVGGLVYPNATLTMEVYQPSSICGLTTPIYTQTVVTSSINLNLGTIVVNTSLITASSITGTVVDCSSNPLANATVVISPFNITVSTNSLGQYNYNFACTPTTPITVYGYDLVNNVYGTNTATLVSGVNNLGTTTACGNVTPYLTLNLINTTTTVSYNTTFLAPGNTILAMVDSAAASSNSTITAYGTTNNYISMVTTDTVAGTFPLTSLYMYLNGSGFTDTQFTVNTGSTISYTAFPLFPGDVLGSYSFNLTGVPSGNTYTATGSFRAPRQN